MWGILSLSRAAGATTKRRWGVHERGNSEVPMHTIYNVYTVSGMTCAHCAASVTEELSELDHVTDVAVNISTGAVTVASANELSRPTVEAALAVAGHRLAD